ncbi:SDR family NAD(P)-dependent oxidoreductase [Mycobacterium aquaticum]|uniref:SDR family NAD(P)-dependent oxidoreductase n=1 Tax=Mycobacterium aquaticum TaxID=1927124 RepID=UPI0009F303BB
MIAYQADVRDYDVLKSGLDSAVRELGRLDIVAANAGIFQFGEPVEEVALNDWTGYPSPGTYNSIEPGTEPQASIPARR